jgi:hypothetical protein
MPSMRQWIATGAVTLALAGCVTPWNTRLPTLEPGVPAAERRSYEIHDPYPEPDLGPETQTRPRDFAEPRSQPRRLIEGRMLRDMAPGSVPAGPALPPSAVQYPQSVHP